MLKKIKTVGLSVFSSPFLVGCLGFGDPFEKEHELSSCLADAKTYQQVQVCHEKNPQPESGSESEKAKKPAAQ
jgi:hypothetical protein